VSIFAFIFLAMRIQLLLLIAFVVLILHASCSNSTRRAPDDEQVLSALKDNQAKVFMEIGGKPFYPDESLFAGNLHLEKDRLSLNVSDQYEGQIILGIYRPSWYRQFPVRYEISEATRTNSRVMIGKIVDKQKRLGEGYLMASGLIEITELTPQKLIMTINGKCGKYDGFELGKDLLDIHGSIIFRKPNVLFLNINWEDLR